MFTTQRLYNYGAKYISVQTSFAFSFLLSTVIAWWLQWLASGAMNVVYAVQCLLVVLEIPVHLRNNPIGSCRK